MYIYIYIYIHTHLFLSHRQAVPTRIIHRASGRLRDPAPIIIIHMN